MKQSRGKRRNLALPSFSCTLCRRRTGPGRPPCRSLRALGLHPERSGTAMRPRVSHSAMPVPHCALVLTLERGLVRCRAGRLQHLLQSSFGLLPRHAEGPVAVVSIRAFESLGMLAMLCKGARGSRKKPRKQEEAAKVSVSSNAGRGRTHGETSSPRRGSRAAAVDQSNLLTRFARQTSGRQGLAARGCMPRQ